MRGQQEIRLAWTLCLSLVHCGPTRGSPKPSRDFQEDEWRGLPLDPQLRLLPSTLAPELRHPEPHWPRCLQQPLLDSAQAREQPWKCLHLTARVRYLKFTPGPAFPILKLCCTLPHPHPHPRHGLRIRSNPHPACPAVVCGPHHPQGLQFRGAMLCPRLCMSCFLWSMYSPHTPV